MGCPLPTGSGLGMGLDFWAQKSEFLCILGLMKPTFQRPGVSIFWPAAVWVNRPPVDTPLGDASSTPNPIRT